MEEQKPIVKSLTVQGLIVTLLGAVLAPRLAKWGVTSEQIGDYVEAIVTAAGGIMVIVGRYRAGGVAGVFSAPK